MMEVEHKVQKSMESWGGKQAKNWREGCPSKGLHQSYDIQEGIAEKEQWREE